MEAQIVAEYISFRLELIPPRAGVRSLLNKIVILTIVQPVVHEDQSL